jgi:uncharacterized membrane protein
VNNSGLIVGMVENGSYVTTPAEWSDPSLPPTLLPTPTGYHDSGANGVNAGGLVVGTTNTTAGVIHPIEWNASTHAATLLPVPSGYTGARASGVNDDGIVVGSAFQSGTGVNVAVVWSVSHVPTVLPTPNGDTNAITAGVDANGTVFGSVISTSLGDYYPVKWDASTHVPAELRTPPGYGNVPVVWVGVDSEVIANADLAHGPAAGSRVAVWDVGALAPRLLPSRFSDGIGYAAGNSHGAIVATAGEGIALVLHAELYVP